GTERRYPPRDLDHQRAAERLPALYLHEDAWLDLPVGQVAQHGGVAVGDADEGGALAGLELLERQRVVLADRQVAVGNRVPVRIDLRVARLRRDELREVLGG